MQVNVERINGNSYKVTFEEADEGDVTSLLEYAIDNLYMTVGEIVLGLL